MEWFERMRQRREEKNLGVREFARIIGASAPAITKWEQGSVDDMKFRTLEKICQVLSCKIEWLMYGSDGGESSGSRKLIEKVKEADAAGVLTDGVLVILNGALDMVLGNICHTKQSNERFSGSSTIDIETGQDFYDEQQNSGPTERGERKFGGGKGR